MGKFISLVNQVFNYLTVINKTDKRTNNGSVIYECVCRCGKIIEVPAYCLKNGNTKSCGCFKIEKATVHGGSYHQLYPTYHNMIMRCTNPNNPSYKDYGEQGITICPDWLDPKNGFIQFITDLPPKPGPEYTLERINVYDGYYPGNVTWATLVDQQRNRTNNVVHSMQEAEEVRIAYHNGKSVASIAKEKNCSNSAIDRIIRKDTWY